ncbi:MAG TPA: ArgR family transcriptional regulator [Tetragenococcus sp.]|nr:ArgR family transcriptional regulator [Tetragenococcus sp.]
MHKNERQALIKQIVSQHTIRTQEELLAYLQKQEVDTTQATISRDIRELQIIKGIDETGQTKFMSYNTEADNFNETNKLTSVINDTVTKIEHVQFLIIIHTLADHANLLSATIDDSEIDEVKCSLAGFDTVVLITASEEQATALEKQLKLLWNETHTE